MAAVGYREPDTAVGARRRLRPRGRVVRTHRLVPHPDVRQTAAELTRAVEAIGDGVLHVTGWERAFGGPDFAARTGGFEFLRESVVAPPATQVWWMPLAFRDALRLRAPDAWSSVERKMLLAGDAEYVDFPAAVAAAIRTGLGLSADAPIPLRSAQEIPRFAAPSSKFDDDDLRSIHVLTGLKRLKISGTRVTDLSPLREMPLLEHLDVQETNVKDLAPLAGLRRLEWLDLYGTLVVDYSPLYRLRGLRWLDLGHFALERSEFDLEADILRRIHPLCRVVH